eukprot:gene9255-19212_t
MSQPISYKIRIQIFEEMALDAATQNFPTEVNMLFYTLLLYIQDSSSNYGTSLDLPNIYHLAVMGIVSIIIITSFIVIFLIYLSTVSHSISGGDSGELVAEGCILGTAHPPGYPLYTILTYLLHLVPLGSVALKVNIFSSFCSSIAACCIGYMVTLSSSSREYASGAVFAMGMFAFSPLIWQYAVTAEVFPLNTMFASVILLLTVRFSSERMPWLALAGAFISGLALCNQHTIVLYEVPLILWMLWLLRKEIIHQPMFLIQLSSAFLLGLSLYMYLPISAAMSPKHGSWGHVTGITGFVHHFLRRDYGTFKLFSGATGRDTEGVYERTEAYFKDVYYTQGLYIVPILAVIGAFGWQLSCPASLAVTTSTTTFTTDDIHYSNQQNVIPINKTSTSTEKALKSSVKSNKRDKKISKTTSTSTSSSNTAMGVENVTDTTLLPRMSMGNNYLFTPLNTVDAAETRYIPYVLLATQVFYFSIFHSLANLPLGDKLLFGVHQRFWMQPNVLLFVWAGMGFDLVISLLCWLLFHEPTNKRKKITTLNTTTTSKEIKSPQSQSSSSSTTMPLLTGLTSLAISLAIVTYQLMKWKDISDQSQTTHFRDYAHALLDPLPESALLLINYDMQWTAIRYAQMCEGHRPDVTTINLSMMTYHWFQHKRSLYPHLIFPGTHHASPDSSAVRGSGGKGGGGGGAFSMHSFVKKNIKEVQIFLGGKFSFKDLNFEKDFELMPVGLRVGQAMPQLPDVNHYPEETWEWTIGRDFKDRVSDTAAFLLQLAISSASTDPQALVEAVYWLETAVFMEMYVHTSSPPPAGLLKNLGLGHAHLVQCKAISGDEPLPLPKVDIFNTVHSINWPYKKDSGRWKEWSSTRFVYAWGEYVNRPEAKHDKQYETVKSMLEVATRGELQHTFTSINFHIYCKLHHTALYPALINRVDLAFTTQHSVPYSKLRLNCLISARANFIFKVLKQRCVSDIAQNNGFITIPHMQIEEPTKSIFPICRRCVWLDFLLQLQYKLEMDFMMVKNGIGSKSIC